MRRRTFSALQATPIHSAMAKPADLRDIETAAPRRLSWMTAGLLASTALAGGAQAATGPGSVSINWDALDSIGGDTIGRDQAVSGIAADVARPVPPGSAGAAVFVPGTWPHSGAPNYGYMRLPRYYGGPVHTPFALTPYQPTDRPALGADPLAAARTFAATVVAIGDIVPDAPLRSTVDTADSFTAAAVAPATHPINITQASTLRWTPGGGHAVRYDPAVFSQLLRIDASTTAGSPGIAATSSGIQASPAATGSFRPVQLAQLAPSTRYRSPSMTDGAPVTAYNEMPYGQVVPRSARHPALPQRAFTNLNATTIRARLHTRRMGPADFLQPTAASSYNAAGPRTRLTPPPRATAPAIWQSHAAPQGYALSSRTPRAVVAPGSANGSFVQPAAAPPYVGRFTLYRPRRGDPLEPPARRPNSAAGQSIRGGAGSWPGAATAADAPVTRLRRGQLTSRIAPGLASGATASSSRRGPASIAAVAPAHGPVIISSATVGAGTEPVAARNRGRSAATPAQPLRQAPAPASPAPASPVVPPSTTNLAPVTTPVAAPATSQSAAAAPAAPQPKPSMSAATQPRPVAPLPPAPSEPITTAAPPMPVVESPPVTGSSTITGALSAPAAEPAMPALEPVAAPAAPPPPAVVATTPAISPSTTTITPATMTPEPSPAPVVDPVPTPLPDGSAATGLAVIADAAAPPAPETAVDTQLATRPLVAAATPGGVLATVTFQPGDPELTDQARATLASMATGLESDENARIQLNAYAAAEADNPASARRLSLTRALAVRKYLIEQGIRSIRMDVRARGSDVPGGSPERVDILLKTQ